MCYNFNGDNMNDEAYFKLINTFEEKAKGFGGQLYLKDWKELALINLDTKEKMGKISASWAENSPSTIFIDDLWVEEPYRERHIATFLMIVFEQLAVINGATMIRLFASGSGNLVAFYEKLGYVRETPTRTIMIKNLTALEKDDTPPQISGMKH